jgi:hypothetical protein
MIGLKEIIIDQKETFNRARRLIKREVDTQKYISSSQVVIITGIRRCGKSSLLFLIKEEMKLHEEAYCYFNFDDERVANDIAILDQIYQTHLKIYGTVPVLFLDEIQNVKGWEKFVNRMHEKGIKLFITGSNANLLSSEISTSLTGRNKVIELFPFSFAEYLRFINKSYDPERLSTSNKALLMGDFEKYCSVGGFPLVVKDNDLELINGYYQDILYRDIVARFRLSQVNELKELGLFLAANIGKVLSYATLQKISGIKSLSTLQDYLSHFQQSYLFFFVKKFDYSVKKQTMNPRKVYTIDGGFANRIGFAFSANHGRLLENLVYLELRRRGKEVYYHAGKHECDFVVKEGIKVTEVIQVTEVLHIENYQRETAGLIEAMDSYPGSKGTLLLNRMEANVSLSEPHFSVIEVALWLLVEPKTNRAVE